MQKEFIKSSVDISERECLFSLKEIKEKIKEIYPTMEESKISYHAHHIEDNDWLKVCNTEEGLEDVVREQVEAIE